MGDMREILDEQTVERVLQAVAVGGPLLGLVLGAGWGVRRKRVRYYLLRGGMVGCLGVLIFGLWRLYSYLVRYDPQTHYLGLEKVSVLLLNLFLFTGVGMIVGLLWARMAPPAPPTAAPSSSPEPGEKKE